MKANVLINAESGMKKQLLEKVRGMQGVIEAHPIAIGCYDIFSKFEGQNYDGLKSNIDRMKKDCEYLLKSHLTLVEIEVPGTRPIGYTQK
jgi:hypothetical protein